MSKGVSKGANKGLSKALRDAGRNHFGGTAVTMLEAMICLVAMLLAIGVIGVIGVIEGHAAPRPAPQAKQAKLVEEGKALFADNCTRCHADGDAPSLDGLFKSKVLPSGAEASDENVRNKILHGGDIMPGYEDKLT
ncbi:MAG TPA: cytochrome c, partial [Candidatus Acidoferrales bacterium]